MNNKRRHRNNFVDEIVDILTKSIQKQTYPPGSQLPSVEKLAEEIGSNLESTSTTECLDGHYASFAYDCSVLAKQQFLDRLVICGKSVNRKVALSILFFAPAIASDSDYVEQGDSSFCILIDANSEVYLFRIWVCIEGFGQANNGIGWRNFNLLEDR